MLWLLSPQSHQKAEDKLHFKDTLQNSWVQDSKKPLINSRKLQQSDVINSYEGSSLKAKLDFSNIWKKKAVDINPEFCIPVQKWNTKEFDLKHQEHATTLVTNISTKRNSDISGKLSPFEKLKLTSPHMNFI